MTIGDPPVLPVELVDTPRDLIHSIGPMLDDRYDSEGNSLMSGESETDGEDGSRDITCLG